MKFSAIITALTCTCAVVLAGCSGSCGVQASTSAASPMAASYCPPPPPMPAYQLGK